MNDKFLLNVRHAILNSGLKHKQVAEELGVSATAFSAFINGRRSFDISIVPQLCDILGCTPNDLYGFTEKAS